MVPAWTAYIKETRASVAAGLQYHWTKAAATEVGLLLCQLFFPFRLHTCVMMSPTVLYDPHFVVIQNHSFLISHRAWTWTFCHETSLRQLLLCAEVENWSAAHLPQGWKYILHWGKSSWLLSELCFCQLQPVSPLLINNTLLAPTATTLSKSLGSHFLSLILMSDVNCYVKNICCKRSQWLPCQSSACWGGFKRAREAGFLSQLLHVPRMIPALWGCSRLL